MDHWYEDITNWQWPVGVATLFCMLCMAKGIRRNKWISNEEDNLRRIFRTMYREAQILSFINIQAEVLLLNIVLTTCFILPRVAD